MFGCFCHPEITAKVQGNYCRASALFIYVRSLLSPTPTRNDDQLKLAEDGGAHRGVRWHGCHRRHHRGVSLAW
jgi:hypothetical protein